MATSVFDVLDSHSTEVTDPDEETFELFTRYNNANTLGMVAQGETSVDVSITGRDMTIQQSPGLLTSSRSGGTTGAVLWNVTLLLARWISSTSNFLFQHGLMSSGTTVLELGAGISGIIGLSLSEHISRYILTDQEYVLKVLVQNVEENRRRSPVQSSKTSKGRKRKAAHHDSKASQNNIDIMTLDWETTDVKSMLRTMDRPPNILIAADCIFNPAAIEPFVSTVDDLSRSDRNSKRPVISIIAQQLRSPDVFSEWLEAMSRKFRIWRLNEDALNLNSEDSIGNLKVEEGYVAHLCVLREATERNQSSK